MDLRMKRAFQSRTRSWSVVEAPCIEAPPATLTFAFGAGDEVREDPREPDLTFGRSDISGPEADGGGFKDGPAVVFGNCFASGSSDNASAFDNDASFLCPLLLPAM